MLYYVTHILNIIIIIIMIYSYGPRAGASRRRPSRRRAAPGPVGAAHINIIINNIIINIK